MIWEIKKRIKEAHVNTQKYIDEIIHNNIQ